MSNALAIAAVTAVLRDLLNNGLVQHDLAAVTGIVNITSKPPDMIKTSDSEAAQLNLFLTHVTPNAAWRNVGLPSRDTVGERLTNPPLALDLHYLLSAYGAQDFAPEILLGYAMQVLHENPALGRDQIRTALKPVSPVTGSMLPPEFQALSAADLADQIEQIKICPETLTLEEISKLWSAFQTSYRVTAAYMVSVVLIESRKSTRTSLPVQKAKVYALPLNRPIVESVASAATPPNDPRITTASTVVVRGANLRGPVTRVKVGEAIVPDGSATLGDSEIRFPMSALPDARAGVQGLQIVHEVPMGEPPVPHRGVESNIAAFVLQPTIAPAVGAGAPTPSISAMFSPAVGKAQRVTLSLYEFNAPTTRAARAYTFFAPKDNGIVNPAQDNTNSITFAISGVVPGQYLVRAQVDGAESLLGLSGGAFDTPKVTVF